MQDLTNADILRRIQTVLRFWAAFYPYELAATQRFATRVRHGQVNQHGVEGLSKEAGLLAWGFYPGTVFNLMTAMFGQGWDVDKRYQNLFFQEFKLGAINQHTGANRDRERPVDVNSYFGGDDRAAMRG